MRTIRICQYSLDKEFFIARSLARQELDFTFDNLFFYDIQGRKSRRNITLIFDISRKIEKQIRNCLDTSFMKSLYIGISRMNERFCEKHTMSISRSENMKNKKEPLISEVILLQVGFMEYLILFVLIDEKEEKMRVFQLNL